MVVTLPLPSEVTKHFPHDLVDFLQWFAFWSFSGLLVIPWLLCIYQVRTLIVESSQRLKLVMLSIIADMQCLPGQIAHYALFRPHEED